jgi:hypothetical protein
MKKEAPNHRRKGWRLFRRRPRLLQCYRIAVTMPMNHYLPLSGIDIHGQFVIRLKRRFWFPKTLAVSPLTEIVAFDPRIIAFNPSYAKENDNKELFLLSLYYAFEEAFLGHKFQLAQRILSIGGSMFEEKIMYGATERALDNKDAKQLAFLLLNLKNGLQVVATYLREKVYRFEPELIYSVREVSPEAFSVIFPESK